MKLGSLEIHPLSDGSIRLDGGAMFGIIPKPLWERRIPADEANRIELGLHPLLVRTGQKNILIDTGMGDKFDPKTIEHHHMVHEPTLEASLAEYGLRPAHIDMVILTHLHFDHCGGNTRLEDGKAVPTFPRARYVIQKGEWEYAMHPDRRSRASYLKENFAPLAEAGLLDLVEGEVEILPGIRCLPTPGHTLHHQSVTIESSEGTVIYFGDLVPTSAHLDLPYIMAYDVEPLVTLREKERILKKVVEEGWIGAFEHDQNVTLARITRQDRGFGVKPVAGE